MRSGRPLPACVAILLLWTGAAAASPQPVSADALRSRATQLIYEHRHDEAIALLRQAVAVAPGGGGALTGSRDGTMRYWDLKSAQTQFILKGHTDNVRALALSAEGARAVSGGGDGTVRLWAQRREVKRLLGPGPAVNSVVFAAQGGHALSGGNDRLVRLWDVESGRELLSLPGITEAVTGLAWDGKSGRIYALDRAVRVWEPK